MPRPPITPVQRKTQRDNIRRAAGEVYNEKGLHGVSVRAIAQRAGISTGTLYSYFDNLSDLMRSLWLEPVAEANVEFQKVADRHSDPIERIRALLNSYADFATAQPEVFRGALLFVRPASLPEPEKAAVEELPFFQLLVTSLIEGQIQGSIKDGDAPLLAHVLWAGTHGALALPINIDRYTVVGQQELVAAMIPALLRSIER